MSGVRRRKPTPAPGPVPPQFPVHYSQQHSPCEVGSLLQPVGESLRVQPHLEARHEVPALNPSSALGLEEGGHELDRLPGWGQQRGQPVVKRRLLRRALEDSSELVERHLPQGIVPSWRLTQVNEPLESTSRHGLLGVGVPSDLEAADGGGEYVVALIEEHLLGDVCTGSPPEV